MVGLFPPTNSCMSQRCLPFRVKLDRALNVRNPLLRLREEIVHLVSPRVPTENGFARDQLCLVLWRENTKPADLVRCEALQIWMPRVSKRCRNCRNHCKYMLHTFFKWKHKVGCGGDSSCWRHQVTVRHSHYPRPANPPTQACIQKKRSAAPATSCTYLVSQHIHELLWASDTDLGHLCTRAQNEARFCVLTAFQGAPIARNMRHGRLRGLGLILHCSTPRP